MPDINLDSLLTDTIDVARKAGAFMQEQAQKFTAIDIEKKGKNDLVSYVDKQSEQMIVEALSKAFPEAGFITEEKTRTDYDKEYRWVIDPLDCTTNYLHKLPAYSVSIGLLQHDKPILGVVYDVAHNEMFTAIAGRGAFMNNVPIRVSTASSLQDSLLATGFPYTYYDYMDAYLELFKHLLKNCQGLRRFGSAAIDLCYLACGRFDGFYEYKLNAWDVAAGGLIVQEAGGKMSDFKGNPDFIFSGSLVASNGHIHDELLKCIAGNFKV